MFLFQGILSTVYAQTTVSLNWQKTAGGAGLDGFNAVKKTTDGGSIAVGMSVSSNGDISGAHGGQDGLVVKFSSTGVKEWAKVFGGTGNEVFSSVVQATDGGYIATGYTNSNDGDVSGIHGAQIDFWVIKLNSSGVLQWQKCFGGTGGENANSIIALSDGSFVLAGAATSTSGDVSGNHGGGDAWLIKISATGTLLWQKCFGGSGSESFASISQTSDGGFIAGGQTSSSDGQVTGFHGVGDYWLVKTDASGNLEWQKTYGGSKSASYAAAAMQTSDGGYFISGTTILSNGVGISGDIAEVKGAGGDIWVLKVTVTGAITWQKTLGGTSADYCGNAIYTTDGGYLVMGLVSSTDGDITSARGQSDIWLVKLNASGAKQWQNSMGGTLDDSGYGLDQLNDCSFLVGGSTRSTDGQVTGNNGGQDAWLTEITTSSLPVAVITSNLGNSICAGSKVTFTAAIDNGGTAPIYQWKKNGVNVGTNNPVYVDSTLTNSDAVKLVLTSNANCITTATVTSNIINISISTPVTPSVTITSNGTTACSGTSVTFTAVPTNGGTPAYQWKKNGANVGTNSATYTSTTLAGGDQIKVVMTSSVNCVTSSTATSNTITMVAGTPVAPSVTLTSNVGSSICSSKTAIFTATPTNGGTAPVYQWKKNGANVHINSPNYSPSGLVVGDVISVVMTSNSGCVTTPMATSNAITMVQGAEVSPSVTIKKFPENSTMYAGSTKTFTAVPVDGGPTPHYSWSINGVVVSTDASYTTSNIVTETRIDLQMVSSSPCASANPVYASTVVEVVPAPTSPDILTSITLTPNVQLTPISGNADYNYKTFVPDDITLVGITAIAREPSAFISINSADYISPPTGGTVNLTGDTTIVDIKAIGADNYTTQTYRILVIKVPAASVNLSNLTISSGQLNPAFSAALTNYTDSVSSSVSFIRVRPTASDGSATIKVNGSAVTSGGLSQLITLNPGDNFINVAVTAAGGTATKTYSIKVRHISANTAVSLKVAGANLASASGSGNENYQTSVITSATSIAITPTLADPKASVYFSSSLIPMANGAPYTVTLTGASTVVHLYVIAEDRTATRHIIITVNKNGSSNAWLSSLELSPHMAVAEDSGPADYNYRIAVNPYTTALQAVATAAGPGATIRVNGNVVASGAASPAVVLNAGTTPTIINTVVTAQDGVTTKTYRLSVRHFSTNANATVKITGANLVKTTGSSTENYVTSVSASATSVTLTATAADPYSSLYLPNNTIVASGVERSIPLTGASTVITLQVVAEDRATTRTISIRVNKNGSSNAWLSTLTLNPNVALTPSSGTANYNYTASVGSTIGSIKLIPTAADATATIRVNSVVVASGVQSQAITLATGANVINTVVTAQDGTTTKTYKLTVTRGLSNNAGVSIAVAGGTLVTVAGTSNLNYATSVSTSATSVIFTPTAAEPNAVIRVNGTVKPSGSPVSVALSGATTTINILATAEDGVTTRTVSLKVNKTGSSNAWLSAITLTNASITQVSTGSGDYNYTATVGSSTTITRLVPTASDASATIRVNGVVVVSGANSSVIPLSTGMDNVITTVVTAEDGVTTKTYTVTVMRPSNDANATLKVEGANLVSVTGTGDENYAVSVSASATSIVLTPRLADPNASLYITNTSTPIADGLPRPISLTGSTTTVEVIVVAENQVTTRRITLKINKTGSSNAWLEALQLDPYYKLTEVVTGTGDYNYTVSVENAISSIRLIPTVSDVAATVRVDGLVVASGQVSQNLALSTGDNIINTVVTAQDGLTTKSYVITIKREPLSLLAALPARKPSISVVQKPEPTSEAQQEDLLVKQAVSPNGDGINDRFTIAGINAFPQNMVRIMNQNGDIIYEAKGYDNQSNAFDGHNSKGTMQLPGTYFYSIEYKKGTETKRKTGYIVVKY